MWSRAEQSRAEQTKTKKKKLKSNSHTRKIRAFYLALDGRSLARILGKQINEIKNTPIDNHIKELPCAVPLSCDRYGRKGN